MFWACEEKPAQFWRNDLLVQSVCELLIEVIKWIKIRFCVNYFIPGNNMMDHLIETDLSYEIDALWRTVQSDQLISETVDICRHCELESTNTRYQFESPAWINRAFIIYQRVDNEYDNYEDLFSTNSPTDLQRSLYEELSDIYKGIHFHQMCVSGADVSDDRIYYLKAKSHLLLAINLCESHERDVIDISSLLSFKSIIAQFLFFDTDTSREASNDNVELNTKRGSTADKQNSLHGPDEQKLLLYHRSLAKHKKRVDNECTIEKTNRSRGVSIAVYILSKFDTNSEDKIAERNTSTYSETDVKFYREWPGQSPTVNISWFIAKAYLANLYYTTQRDVSLTIQTCDDIIDVYWQSHMNRKFAEDGFPVVLSTQWTSIYDKEIQELLGFYSLCSYVLDKSSSRSVYLGFCTVQFALYVKLCAAVRAAHVFSVSTITKYVGDYDGHIHVCRYDDKVHNGFNALSRACFIFFLNFTDIFMST